MREFLKVAVFCLFGWILGMSTAAAYGQVGPSDPRQPRQIDNSGSFRVEAADLYVAPGVNGPAAPSAVAPVEDSWGRYDQGEGSRLAVLVTDVKSDWLGLAHGLKSAGIPFRLTKDYREALRHKAILAYPMISGGTVSTEAVAALSQHVQNGGVLVAVQPLANSMRNLFGFTEAIPSRQQKSLSFQKGALSWALDDAREAALTINGSAPEAVLGTYSFLFPTGKVVAAYEDGKAAIIRKDYGGGAAYAVGLDLGHWLLTGYNSRAESSARSYVNDYEPSLDILLQWLKEVYRNAEKNAVFLGSVPSGKALAVLLTHDVDFTKSVVNALAYAEYEKSMGIRGTYFIQTKYIRDYYDEIFFNEAYLPYLRKLKELGMEVGSHTVSHSYVFADLPLGSGAESYPSYQPFISGRYAIHNATVLGELRVSKFLLEQGTGAAVASFRAGHLQNPLMLPQALAATGYRYSSNVTANTALTQRPFQLNYSRSSQGEVPIYEFPIAIEDELEPPMDKRLDKALALSAKVARYGGLLNVLIHPNVLGEKLAFEQGLVNALKDKAWFGSLGEYGRWWAARDAAEADVSIQGQLRQVRLRLTQAVEELPLEVPAGWMLQSGPGRIQGGQVLISAPAGEAVLTFTTP